MKILIIAYNTIKRNFRDYKTLSLTLLFPIVLILILGTALTSQYSPSNMGKIKVAYFNEDKGDISKRFDELLNNEKIKEFIEVSIVKSSEEGKKLVEENKANSFIMIDKDFTEKIIKGEESKIKVYSKKTGSFYSMVVKNIVDSFGDGFNTVKTINSLTGKFSEYKTYKNIENVPISAKGNIPRAIDYYAVTMLVMTLMYDTISSAVLAGEDIYEAIGNRVKCTPVKFYELFLGKLLGLIATFFLKAVMIICFSKYVYGVNFGENMPVILFITFSFSVFSTSFGIMTAFFAKDEKRAVNFLNGIVPLFTFLSGGYTKFSTFGSLEKIIFFIPNKLGHEAFFNTIYNGSSQIASKAVLSLWAMSILMFIFSSLKGRRVKV
ncbi:ABC transporter permease [Caloramator sp. E03]|uniref:ABC transporter permease n=1 Tax=Caloramator sp. E03 TaxID=2576307 RepID=UPI001110F4A6|nr:ABC transporter permease [Caloramator sp. E03]QCX33166.1 ABC transporter permease [Caloramator sp. E03]